MKQLLRIPIWLYRYGISPFTAGSCRFTPSCSAYASEAIDRHGAFRGGLLALRRLLRCHPWGGCGVDPVPTHLNHKKRKQPVCVSSEPVLSRSAGAQSGRQ